jgi:hypothetical protein
MSAALVSVASSDGPKQPYEHRRPDELMTANRSDSTFEPRPQAGVRVVDALTSCLDGHYLPLLTDKIRNNMRSRVLLVGLYMAGTAFVSILLVVAFSFQQVNTLELTMPVHPPSTMYIGEIAPSFAAQIRNHDLQGVEGLWCVASAMPIAPFSLNAIMMDFSVVATRTIGCFQSLLAPGGVNTMDDFLFCTPSAYPGGSDITNRLATSNSKGICTFDHFSLGFGAIGTYLLIVLLVDPMNSGQVVGTVAPLSFFVSMKSNLQSLSPTSSNVFLPFATTATGFYISSQQDPSAAASNLTAEVFFTLSRPDAVMATVCAAVLSLNLQTLTGQSPLVVEPPTDTLEKSISFLNYSNVACTSSFTFDNSTGLYRAEMVWPNIIVVGANSKQLYFGLSSLGISRPLNSIYTPSYYPKALVASVTPITPVSSVVGTGVPPNMTELSSLSSITVTVRDAQGLPLAGRLVYLSMRPAPGPPVAGTAALLSPYVLPKRIMFGISATDSNGNASFSQSFCSSSGAVGLYEIVAVCDGVQATWPVQSSQSSTSPRFVLSLVTSAVSVAEIEFTGGLSSTMETVGTPWAVLPVLRLLTANGVPIPGKIVDIRPLYPSQSAGVTQSVPSSDDGTAFVVSYTSSFVNSSAPGITVNVSFGIFVDGLLFAQFVRPLIAPPSLAGICTHVMIRSPLPNWTYIGVSFTISTVAVTGTGVPVAGAPVQLEVSSKFITPPVGSNMTVVSTVTDQNGNGEFKLRAAGVPLTLGLYASLSCTQASSLASVTSPQINNYLGLSLVSRIASVVPSFLNSTTIAVKVQPTDWSLVSADSPIPVTALVSWFPFYAITAYRMADQPIPEIKYVTNSGDAIVLITMANSPITPGSFGLVFQVDTSLFPPFTNFNIQGRNISVALVKSFALGQSGTPVVLERGPVPQQPSVQIFHSVTGEPLVGYKVFAQLLINTSSGIVAQSFSEDGDIYFGLFADGNHSVSKAADANGTASFANLTIASVAAGFSFSFRYCVGVGIQDSLTSPSYDVCVNDTIWAILGADSAVVYVTSTTVVSGTQGQPLPTISVFAVTKVPMMFLCAPTIVGQLPTALVSSTRVTSTDGSAAVFSNLITPAPYLADGVYTLRFVCSAGAADVSVVLSSAVASINVVLAPSPSVQTSILTVVPFLVQLVAASGQPVASVFVAAYASPGNSKCILRSCGTLDPASIMYAQTASDGTALFTFVLDSSAKQSLNVVFQEGDQRSPLAASQSARDAYATASAEYGLPRHELSSMLLQRVGQLSDFIVVLDSVAGGSGSSSSTALTPNSGSTSGSPLEAVKKLFGLSAQAVSAETTFLVYNPVTAVVIRQQPAASTFVLPLSVASLSATSAQQPTVFQFDEAFVVDIYLDAVESSRLAGAALPNPLAVDVFCNRCDVTTRVVRSAAARGNQSQPLALVISVTALIEFNASSPCTFQLYFTGLGGGGNFSAEYSVELTASISRTEIMQYIAGFIVMMFSPMLASTVPHARRLYALMSILAVGAMTAGVWYSNVLLPADDPFYHAYWFFLMVLTALVSAWSVLVSLLDYLSYVKDFYLFRFVNDEGKALQTFEYTQWLINARAARQSASSGKDGDNDAADDDEDDDEGTKKSDKKRIGSESIVEGLRTKFYRAAARTATKINSFSSKGELIDVDLLLQETQGKRKKKAVRVFQYDHEHLHPTYLPANFLIVIAIAVVLLVILNFIAVFLYRLLLRNINRLLTYLPSVDDAADVAQVNEIVVFALVRAVELVVTLFPQFSGLGQVIGPLQSIDLVSILAQVRHFIAEGVARLEISFIIATCTAFLVYIATLVTTAMAIPDLLKAIRRGKLVVSQASMTSLEGYIGLHCWQLLVVHQIVLWPTALVAFLLSIADIRFFLWEKLKVLVLSSIVAYLISFGLDTLFVQGFLCGGSSYTVLRQELYSIWHYVGLILGIFTGFMSSVVRWVKSIAFISLLFARLDFAIYPELFASADSAHGGFMSVVNVEAKNGNPVFVTFAMLLMVEQELRRLADCREYEGDSTAAIHPRASRNSSENEVPVSLLFRGSAVASSIRNVARIYLRDAMRAPHDLRDRGAPKFISLKPFSRAQRRAAKERVRARFWLALLLLHNPSLIPLRKHNLFEVDC